MLSVADSPERRAVVVALNPVRNMEQYPPLLFLVQAASPSDCGGFSFFRFFRNKIHVSPATCEKSLEESRGNDPQGGVFCFS